MARGKLVNPTGTLVLTRRDVAGLLTMEECIVAVERAFRLYGEGKTAAPGILGIHAPGGAFHIKAGLLGLEREYFAMKANANFMQNRSRHGLPNIQGIILLSDAERGTPLAVMDSIEITMLRTGAATAVAARHLARADSRWVTICGCGTQGRVQLGALTRMLPIEHVNAFDVVGSFAERFAVEMSDELRLPVRAANNLAAAVKESDVVVTCTSSKRAFLFRDYVQPGTFIAAVGADSEEKHELEPALFTGNKIVADILDQSATVGDLHHAIAAGLVTRADVHAELGEVVAGKKPGRTSNDEIIIFDSTGTALQDAAAAAAVYEKAVKAGRGIRVELGA